MTIRYLTPAVRSLLFNVELGEVPTDNFGYFSLPMAAAGRPFVLDITSEEYPFTSSGVCSALQGKPSLCGVQVTGRSQVVRGTVMDRYGKPAPGVLVRLQASADRESLSADQRASIALARSANKSVRSQSDGAFSFAGVPLGSFTIIAGEAPLVTSARNQLSTSGETASVILRLP